MLESGELIEVKSLPHRGQSVVESLKQESTVRTIHCRVCATGKHSNATDYSKTWLIQYSRDQKQFF